MLLLVYGLSLPRSPSPTLPRLQLVFFVYFMHTPEKLVSGNERILKRRSCPWYIVNARFTTLNRVLKYNQKS